MLVDFKHKKGFSLIEIVMTIVIISLSGVIIIPRIQLALQKQAYLIERERIYQEIKNIRERAIIEQRSVGFSLLPFTSNEITVNSAQRNIFFKGVKSLYVGEVEFGNNRYVGIKNPKHIVFKEGFRLTNSSAQVIFSYNAQGNLMIYDLYGNALDLRKRRGSTIFLHLSAPGFDAESGSRNLNYPIHITKEGIFLLDYTKDSTN